MLDEAEEFNSLIHTITEIVKADQLDNLLEILANSYATIEQTHMIIGMGARSVSQYA